MPAKSTRSSRQSSSPRKGSSSGRKAAGGRGPGKRRAKAVEVEDPDEQEEQEAAPSAVSEEDEPYDAGDAKEDDSYEDEDGEAALDSDALDDDSDDYAKGSKKRKRGSHAVSPSGTRRRSKSSPKKASPKKRRRKAEQSEDDDDELDLKEGQEVVGVVVQAPKTGRVPPGQISRNTFDFLSQLTKPECNDREWFKLHEPVYRLAEKEWKDFIEHFTSVLIEVDPQIPHLPPKDVIHRIYRDVRFSNDKTPYKTALSGSFSRGGRKGIWAHYHMLCKPGGQSLIAAGAWCPGRHELATMRSNIMRSPRRLRETISSPEFVRYFGPSKAHPKGERQNIFGNADELKTAPKGVDKTHPDIDLLKCRSFSVVHWFLDSEVLHPDFKESLRKVATVMQPFVHCLNDMMTLQNAADSDAEDEDQAASGSDEDS